MFSDVLSKHQVIVLYLFVTQVSAKCAYWCITTNAADIGTDVWLVFVWHYGLDKSSIMYTFDTSFCVAKNMERIPRWNAV